MKLFRTQTRVPELYSSTDVSYLQARIRDLEEVVEKYRTKRVGPYKVTLTISSPTWPQVVQYLKYLAEVAEKSGPDCLGASGGDSGGTNYTSSVESNMHRGPGETADDMYDPEEPA